jgi:hypothetical protein
MHLDAVVDDMNDETLDPWADLQAEAGTDTNSPLNPFLEKELLKHADLSMDGSLFTRTTGFKCALRSEPELELQNANLLYRYKHPKLTKAEVEDIIESYKRMNWWP